LSTLGLCSGSISGRIIHRLGLTFDLMEAYGLTDKEGVSLIIPREATEEEAGAFHTDDYLEILRLAGSGIWTSNLASYGLGTLDNPIFPDVYSWGMLVAGSSIDAAGAILAGGIRVLSHKRRCPCDPSP